jgi:hypothetical protein
MLGRQATPRFVQGECNAHGTDSSHETGKDGEDGERHDAMVAHHREPRPPSAETVRGDALHSLALEGAKVDDEDFALADTDSAFADAIREHLALKGRNARLDPDMPLERYLEEDPLENHPLFKSEEQARIEETLGGETGLDLSSERLPWPGEETAEDVEGAALDEALWTGRPRDFDWGD